MNIRTWQERVNQAAEFGERLLAFDAALSEIDELRAALKAQPVQEPANLKADAERLDWLQEHPTHRLQKHKKSWSCVPLTSYEHDVFKTVREAIDAAMKETK